MRPTAASPSAPRSAPTTPIGGQGGTDRPARRQRLRVGQLGHPDLGDTNGADEQWVGDVPGNYSLTGLGDIDETKFISNGGDFGNDTGNSFASNPAARPTVRYDFDIMGFGLSLSSNRDLTDIGVGAGYSADFGGGSWSAGIGYYNFDSFDRDVGDPGRCSRSPTRRHRRDRRGCRRADDLRGRHGEQWSVGLKGTYDAFGFGLTYVKLTSDTTDFGRVRCRQHPGRRLLRLGQLRGRPRLRQDPERRAAMASRISTATTPSSSRPNTTSAAAPRSTAVCAGPTTSSVSATTSRRLGLDRRLRYLDGVLIPVNGTVRGKGGLRPAFFF